jgi:exosome complex component RRP4
VQAINRQDGNVALHMRGSKYGKLRYGQLVCVPCKLIRRQSSHFVDLDDYGIQLVLGCNGWIFVALKNKSEVKAERRAAPFGAGSAPAEFVDFKPEPEQWKHCARFATAIRCVAKLGVPISVDLLQEIVQSSDVRGVSCTQMLQMEFLAVILQLEMSRRGSEDIQNMDEG